MDFQALSREKFERLCKQLVIRHFHAKTLTGEGGDDGSDSFIGTIDHQVHVFQFKYFHKLNYSRWKQIEHSLSVSNEKKKPKIWTLMIPCEFTKMDWKKWEKLERKYRHIKLKLADKTQLEKLVSEEKRFLISEYWELFPIQNLAREAVNAVMEKTAKSYNSEYEIPYSVIGVKKFKKDNVLNLIVNAINVQLYDQNDRIPYVNFDDFNSVLGHDKLMFVGDSGSGKSRTMIEVAIRLMSQNTKDNIIIIHPYSSQLKVIKGKIEDIMDIPGSNLIIWDNFPRGLPERNVDSLHKALEIITSRDNYQILLGLDPNYRHLNSELVEKTTDIHGCTLTYDKDRIRSLLERYGLEIGRFKGLYQEVKQEIDNITDELWKKQPLPLTVKQYYEEFWKDARYDPLFLAKSLDTNQAYFEKQFARLSAKSSQSAYLDFLYTLKISYIIKKDRSIKSISELQQKIFGTSPPSNPLSNLASWLYIDQGQYSMHDASKDGIVFDDDRLVKIMTFLVHSDKINAKDEELARFLGENINYVTLSETEALLQRINRFLDQHDFAFAFGFSLAKILFKVDDKVRERILKTARMKDSLAIGIGRGLGYYLGNSSGRFEEIVKIAKNNKNIPDPLLYSIGLIFDKIPESIQDRIIHIVKTDPDFKEVRFGTVGDIFPVLSRTTQSKLLSLAQDNESFKYSLLTRISYAFNHLPPTTQNRILRFADNDDNLAIHLGLGIGEDFYKYDKDTRGRILDYAKKNTDFSEAVAVEIGDYFHIFSDQEKNEIITYAKSDPDFARALGEGIGRVNAHLKEDANETLKKFAIINDDFAYGWGFGIALSNREQQRSAISKIEIPMFLLGLGNGLASDLIRQSFPIQEQKMKLASTNRIVAFGFLEEASKSLKSLKQRTKRKIIKMARDLGFTNVLRNKT